MKTFKEFVNEARNYKLIGHDKKELDSFDYHGDTYYVIKVFKDEVLAEGPSGEEEMFDIDDIIKQDDMVKGIK